VNNILITGASGMIGTELTRLLQERGFDVSHLSRSPRPGYPKTYLWDVNKHEVDEEALQKKDVVVHLAGAGVADKRWTKERKNEILKSRTDSARILFDVLQKGNHDVKTFISASGIGFYGFEDNNRLFTENDPQGNDFLAEVVHQWEAAADQIASLGIRVVKIRIGIVLSEKGGALKEMMRPLKFYAGAPLGSGTQHMSWIHLNDLCRIFIKAMEDDSMHGVYNAVAPNPVTNREFTYALARVLRKQIILPSVPPFVLKLLLGEMADVVLKGAKVSSQKIQASGYQFKFEKLDDALRNLLKHH
jgi:uncharacterized protein (TIGR01777 family)